MNNDKLASKPDLISGLFWALAFIVLGSLLLAEAQGWLAGGKWLPWFLTAIGALCLVDVLVRFINPAHRNFRYGTLVIGIILTIIGVSLLTGFAQWLPLALIFTGIAIGAGFCFRRTGGFLSH